MTQVLADGANTYLYGLGRIGEQQPGGWSYHLGDALGSVRQLVDATGEVSLARNYEPYGDMLSSIGDGSSVYQFTGEMRDVTGLTYLRARYLDGGVGRFITRDSWQGDYRKPLSMNGWNYVVSNPLNYIDPTGYLPLTILDDETGMWAAKEDRAIESAALDVARRLARTVNERLFKDRKRIATCNPLLSIVGLPNVSPNSAFLRVYGGSVTFTHVSYSCLEGCWGRSTGPRNIRLYKPAKVVGIRILSFTS